MYEAIYTTYLNSSNDRQNLFNFMKHFHVFCIGVCQCNHSYTGDDCSVNLDRPPVLFDTSKESLCDLTKRPCTSISLFGDGFYQSGTITCQLREAMVRNLYSFITLRRNSVTLRQYKLNFDVKEKKNEILWIIVTAIMFPDWRIWRLLYQNYKCLYIVYRLRGNIMYFFIIF